ncbi:MAG TPA: hypothetical protein VH234_03785 [Candidatus Saccharimonadales bacterium]|jgi:hypothetical protein|nr:hypothetical protein [Candidatus Saccharimonadales bacterium]
MEAKEPQANANPGDPNRTPESPFVYTVSPEERYELTTSDIEVIQGTADEVVASVKANHASKLGKRLTRKLTLMLLSRSGLDHRQLGYALPITADAAVLNATLTIEDNESLSSLLESAQAAFLGNLAVVDQPEVQATSAMVDTLSEHELLEMAGDFNEYHTSLKKGSEQAQVAAYQKVRRHFDHLAERHLTPFINSNAPDILMEEAREEIEAVLEDVILKHDLSTDLFAEADRALVESLADLQLELQEPPADHSELASEISAHIPIVNIALKYVYLEKYGSFSSKEWVKNKRRVYIISREVKRMMPDAPVEEVADTVRAWLDALDPSQNNK